MSIHYQSTLAEPEHGRAIKIRVFEHGDINNKCYEVYVNPNHLRTWNSILQYLTNIINPSFGAIRKLVSVRSKKCISNFKDLEANGKYIAVRNANRIKLDRNRFKTLSELKLLENAIVRKSKNRFYSTDLDFDKFTFLFETKKKKRTIIFILVSGRIYQEPSKVVLTTDDIISWNMILEFLSKLLDVPDGIQYLCTIFGDIVIDPASLQHGCLYIAKPFNEKFRKMNYLNMFNEWTQKRNNYEFVITRARHLGGNQLVYVEEVKKNEAPSEVTRVSFKNDAVIESAIAEYDGTDKDSISEEADGLTHDTAEDKRTSNASAQSETKKKPSYILLGNTVIIGSKKYVLVSDENGEFGICQRDQLCQTCISDEKPTNRNVSYSELNYFDPKNKSSSQDTFEESSLLDSDEDDNRERSVSKVFKKNRDSNKNQSAMKHLKNQKRGSLEKWVSGYLEEKVSKIGEVDEQKTTAETETETEKFVAEVHFTEEKEVITDMREESKEETIIVEEEVQTNEQEKIPEDEKEEISKEPEVITKVTDENEQISEETINGSKTDNIKKGHKKRLSKEKKNVENGEIVKAQPGKNACPGFRRMQPIYIHTKMDINLCNLAKTNKNIIYSAKHAKIRPFKTGVKSSSSDIEKTHTKEKTCCFCLNKNEAEHKISHRGHQNGSDVKKNGNEILEKRRHSDGSEKIIPPVRNEVIVGYASNKEKNNGSEKGEDIIQVDVVEDCEDCNGGCEGNICHACSCISVDSIEAKYKLEDEVSESKRTSEDVGVGSNEETTYAEQSVTDSKQSVDEDASCICCTCSHISLDSIDGN